LDSGYLTFLPGTRAALFYWTPTADPNVIALDERLKDTVSGTEFGEAVPLFNSPPPATAPSRAMIVPTLIVLGQHDAVFCDEDGIICDHDNVKTAEAPYYSPQARIRVYVAPETGHDLQLHKTAPETGERILDWLLRGCLPVNRPERRDFEKLVIPAKSLGATTRSSTTRRP
jgi:pimeloyl-ACP methyl ester carboxylesterase